MKSRGLAGRHRKVDRAPQMNGLSAVNGVRKMRRLFVLSAFHEATGKQQAARLRSFLESRLEHVEDDFMEDLSYTLAECRTHHPWRKAITACTAEELHNALENGSRKFLRSKRAVKLGFVLTGQGAQWYAMGRELMTQYPIFRESLLRGESYLTAMGAHWSLIGIHHTCETEDSH